MRSARLEQFAHRIWQGNGLLSGALLPLSRITGAVAARRRRRFAQPGSRAESTRPVIVVGNIYVGGTGKTPVVIALVQALQARGWTPGVVSRGYGSPASELPRAGRGELDPRQFGDEPALIAAATGAPVCVHRRRAAALRRLEQAYPQVDVVIADDGLQHLALARDIEIAVQDSRGIGNGRLLPAGPLREPATRLAEVDYVVTNLEPDQPPSMAAGAGGHGRGIGMRLVPVRLQQLNSGRTEDWDGWMEEHGRRAAGALAGIGFPRRFFNMLRHCGVQLEKTVALSDHGALNATLLASFGAGPILITAKDAVKCAELNDPRIWVVHAAARFSDPRWVDDVSRRLHAIAEAKRGAAAASGGAGSDGAGRGAS